MASRVILETEQLCWAAVKNSRVIKSLFSGTGYSSTQFWLKSYHSNFQNLILYMKKQMESNIYVEF